MPLILHFPAEIETLLESGNIYAISLDVTKCMGKRVIYAPIYDGTPVNDHLSAIGCFAAKNLLDLTSFKGIVELTQAKNVSSVRNAQKNSCDPIT